MTGSTSPAGSGHEDDQYKSAAAHHPSKQIDSIHTLIVIEDSLDRRIDFATKERDSLREVYNTLLAQNTTP